MCLRESPYAEDRLSRAVELLHRSAKHVDPTVSHNSCLAFEPNRQRHVVSVGNRYQFGRHFFEPTLPGQTGARPFDKGNTPQRQRTCFKRLDDRTLRGGQRSVLDQDNVCRQKRLFLEATERLVQV